MPTRGGRRWIAAGGSELEVLAFEMKAHRLVGVLDRLVEGRTLRDYGDFLAIRDPCVLTPSDESVDDPPPGHEEILALPHRVFDVRSRVVLRQGRTILFGSAWCRENPDDRTVRLGVLLPPWFTLPSGRHLTRALSIATFP